MGGQRNQESRSIARKRYSFHVGISAQALRLITESCVRFSVRKIFLEQYLDTTISQMLFHLPDAQNSKVKYRGRQ
jgi:hypothetical protein